MKKLFLFIILISSFCFGQNDVFVNLTGNSPVILESGRLWNNATINTYIFKPPQNYSVINLYIRSRLNNSTRNYTVAYSETSDSTVNGFNTSTCGSSGTSNCSGFWKGGIFNSWGDCSSITTGGVTNICSIFVRNSALVAITFNNGATGTGNYDLIIDFNNTVNSGVSQIFGNSVNNFPQPVNLDSVGNLPVTLKTPLASTINSINASTNAVIEIPAFSGWSLTSSPASGTQATATQGSCGTQCSLTLNCISFSASASAAVAATNVVVSVVDNTTTNAIWQMNIDLPTSAGLASEIPAWGKCGLNIPISQNTSITCKFSAAVANVIESINCSGFSINSIQ